MVKGVKEFLLKLLGPDTEISGIKIDKFTRSKRKTVAIQITNDGSLIMRAPKRMASTFIEWFLEQKKEWILSKQLQAKKNYNRIALKKFVFGEEFSYLGKDYKLFIVDNAIRPLEYDDCFRLSKHYIKQAEDIFIDWYKAHARLEICEAVKFYSLLSGIKYEKIRIMSARKRWGSCSSNGNLNFTWRLVLAPKDVIDYVVVHELVHIKHRNHSKLFWNRVAKILPDYAKSKKWLRDNSFLLEFL